MIRAPSDQNARIGIGPTEPPPNQKRKESFAIETVLALVTIWASPCMMPIEPSVTTNDGILKNTTASPFMRPTPAPNRTPISAGEQEVIVPREKHGGDQRRDRHDRRNRKVDLAGAENEHDRDRHDGDGGRYAHDAEEIDGAHEARVAQKIGEDRDQDEHRADENARIVAAVGAPGDRARPAAQPEPRARFRGASRGARRPP